MSDIKTDLRICLFCFYAEGEQKKAGSIARFLVMQLHFAKQVGLALFAFEQALDIAPVHPNDETAQEEAHKNREDTSIPMEPGVDKAKGTGGQNTAQGHKVGCKIGNQENTKYEQPGPAGGCSPSSPPRQGSRAHVRE